MPNTQLTASIIAKASLAILDNELDVLGTFYRAIEPEFEKRVNGYEVGSTVNIRRPADFTVRNVITASPQDVIEGQVPLVIDQVRGVDFSFTSTELTLNIKELGERVLRPAVINIVNEVARDCMAEMYRGTYNWVGTPASPVANFASFARAPLRLDENAVPNSQRYSALNPSDFWSMVGSQTQLYAPGLINPAYRDGSLGNVGGLETLMTQVMPTHVVGVGGGTPTVSGASQNVLYDAVKNTWSQPLVMTGWSASTAGVLRAGDVFTIAGCFAVNPKTRAVLPFLQQFVSLTDQGSGAGGALTATISPPIIASGPYQTVSAAPANGAAIVLVGGANLSYRQNLAYHKNAFALAMVPMTLPPGSVEGARETKNGISIRVVPFYDGTNDKSTWRMDVLYGRKLIDARLSTRFNG